MTADGHSRSLCVRTGAYNHNLPDLEKEERNANRSARDCRAVSQHAPPLPGSGTHPSPSIRAATSSPRLACCISLMSRRPPFYSCPYAL